MTRVTVLYHSEPEGCWAESNDVPGFSAAADTLPDLRDQVAGSIPYFLEDEDVELVEVLAFDAFAAVPEPAPPVPRVAHEVTSIAAARLPNEAVQAPALQDALPL